MTTTFISPYPVERCRELLAQMQLRGNFFSSYSRMVKLVSVPNGYHFEVRQKQGRRVTIVATGLLTAETDQTTQVTVDVSRTQDYLFLVALLLIAGFSLFYLTQPSAVWFFLLMVPLVIWQFWDNELRRQGLLAEIHAQLKGRQTG